MKINISLSRFFLTLFLGSILFAAPGSCAETHYSKPLGWVSDYARVIDPASKWEIMTIIKQISNKTSCEIVVVTVPELTGGSIEEFANEIFNRWHIGKREQDNGVLIVAAIADRKARIEVGYGLEEAITDGKSGEILDKSVIPFFKNGEYGKGLLEGTRAVAETIAAYKNVQLELTNTPANIPTSTPEVQPAQEERTPVNPIKLIFNILIFIILLIFFIRHPLLFLLFMGGSGRGGRFGGGFGGGGFGGFGGGASGGGGASRGW